MNNGTAIAVALGLVGIAVAAKWLQQPASSGPAGKPEKEPETAREIAEEEKARIVREFNSANGRKGSDKRWAAKRAAKAEAEAREAE